MPERKKRHGMSGTKLYRTYTHMHQRCENPNGPSYHKYGGKGVRCDWTSFEDFRKDMEAEYEKHVAEHGEANTSIDRIDSRGNYNKKNCRWATYEVQNTNRRNTLQITVDGITKPLTVWCAERGLNWATIQSRIFRYGWDAKRAIETPTGSRGGAVGIWSPSQVKRRNRNRV